MVRHLLGGRRQSGLTAIELMIGVVIVGILLTIAVPSFIDQMARRRLEGAASELSNDLAFARTQAVSQNAQISLTSSADGTGYAITGAVPKAVTLHPQIVFAAASRGLATTYDPLRGTALTARTYDLTSSGTSASMRLVVNIMGRVELCSPGGTLSGHTAC
jgi:type IV fimbrial biogenesis protein FimT